MSDHRYAVAANVKRAGWKAARIALYMCLPALLFASISFLRKTNSVQRVAQWGVLFACILGNASVLAASRVSSVELIRNHCSVMQEFLDELGVEFINPNRKIDLLPQPLLDRLSSNKIDTIEELFKCFKFQEAKPSQEDLKYGVVRKIIADINIARLQVTSDSRSGSLEVLAHVTLVVRQTQDGSLISWGEYRVG